MAVTLAHGTKDVEDFNRFFDGEIAMPQNLGRVDMSALPDVNLAFASVDAIRTPAPGSFVAAIRNDVAAGYGQQLAAMTQGVSNYWTAPQDMPTATVGSVMDAGMSMFGALASAPQQLKPAAPEEGGISMSGLGAAFNTAKQPEQAGNRMARYKSELRNG